MISIPWLASMDICRTKAVMTGSFLDRNSITFFVLQWQIVADVSERGKRPNFL